MNEGKISNLYREKKKPYYFRSWLNREQLERLAETLGKDTDDLIELIFLRGLFDLVKAHLDMMDSTTMTDMKFSMSLNAFIVHLRNTWFLYCQERGWSTEAHINDPSNTVP